MASYLKARYSPVDVLLETLICDLLCILLQLIFIKKQNCSIVIVNLYTGVH